MILETRAKHTLILASLRDFTTNPNLCPLCKATLKPGAENCPSCGEQAYY